MHLTEHDEVASPHLPLGQPASLARRMRQPVNPFLPVAGSRLCQSDALPSAWQFENRIRKLSGRSPLMLRHRAHSSPNNLRSGLGLGSPMKRRAPRAGLLLGQALDAVVGPPGSERKREVGKDFGAAPAPAAIGSALARACEDSRNSVVPAAQRSTGGSLTARPRRASAPNALAPLPRPTTSGGIPRPTSASAGASLPAHMAKDVMALFEAFAKTREQTEEANWQLSQSGIGAAPSSRPASSAAGASAAAEPIGKQRRKRADGRPAKGAAVTSAVAEAAMPKGKSFSQVLRLYYPSATRAEIEQMVALVAGREEEIARARWVERAKEMYGAEISRFFGAADADGGGSIDIAEFRAAVSSFGLLDAEVNALFAGADHDGNGVRRDDGQHGISARSTYDGEHFSGRCSTWTSLPSSSRRASRCSRTLVR